MKREIVFLLCLVCSQKLLAGDNLLFNSNFENSSATVIGNWRQYTYGTKGGKITVIYDKQQAHSGNICLRLETEGRGYIGVMQAVGQAWHKVVWPGRRYLVGGYARGKDANLEIAFHLYGDKVVLPKDFKNRFSFPVTEQWQCYATVITIPEGVTWMNVNFDIKGGQAGPLYLDDVFFHDEEPAVMRYLPSLERLCLSLDSTFARWQYQIPPEETLSARIEVLSRQAEKSKTVLKETIKNIGISRTSWRKSTTSLPEGTYTVKVELVDKTGKVLGETEDWLEKKIFPWMKKPSGLGEKVPTGYTALTTKGRSLYLWGREYVFATDGLLEKVISQGKQWLKGKMELSGEVDSKKVSAEVKKPFVFTREKPQEVTGQAVLRLDGLAVELETLTEYDGLVRYRLTYGPSGKEVKVSRLQLKVPLDDRWCKFYSCDGMPWLAGPSGRAERAAYLYQDDATQGFSYDILPSNQGLVFSGLDHQQSGGLTVTFNGLFWVGDEETCFCYAADNDKGWINGFNKPAVEVFREGQTLVLWLNLINQEVLLKEPRTLELAFQAGPVKALPENWRGYQNGGDIQDAPFPVNLASYAGSGYTLNGGTHFIHPGTTPEQQQKSKEKIDKEIAAGNKGVIGYHFWGTVPKGFEETKVFRTEWGIDKMTWEKATQVRDWEWKNRFYGPNQELYIMMNAKTVPSYVEFITYAYELALQHTGLSGFYDDCGYPRVVYDEELGLGYLRQDGATIASSGLWIYRERWKRAAYLNFLYNRPNLLWDSQHVHAHYLPAYGFIGCWAPCEHGYYNPFLDRDNLDFYGSVERYAAFNPARAFGQIPMVGMSSPQKDTPSLSRDTRGMMMLAFLHDQDVGSFGNRDKRIVARLRHARNTFRVWEEEVEFIGYWQSDDWVKVENPEVKVSFYKRPQAVLLVLGNTSKVSTNVFVQPSWNKLQIDPQKVTLYDAETGIKLSPGEKKSTGFSVEIPAHDLRLLVLNERQGYVDESACQPLGRNLPGPKKVFPDLSASFTAEKQLENSWIKESHQGVSGATILDGRLCIWGNHYGFSHVRRQLSLENFSVQCLILRAPTGCSDEWGGSLFLYWANGQYLQATPGTGQGKFFYCVSATGAKWGSNISRKTVAGWYPYSANWVKVVLKPQTIEFYCSFDGFNWVKDWETKRSEKHQGPVQFLILGNGSPGKEPFLKNSHPQHFSPANPSTWFFSDLVVGQEE